MQVHVQLTGRTPLVQHNIRLANPDDEITKAIGKLTHKRTKTEEDRLEIARLEWFGGLYADKDGPFIPTANMVRCFEEAAKVRKLGKAIVRSVVMTEWGAHIDYGKPRTLEELQKDETYRLVMAVGVQTSRMMRTRPMFPQWQISTAFELLTDIMDEDVFRDIVELAGRAEGLGDARKLGYGRFHANVTPV